MSKKIRALLVGINAYSPAVGKLSGCVNDVDNFHDYLTDNFDQEALQIEVLKDADATRSNIIEQFRSHLCKASSDDVVLFQYCGHGARWKSAGEFAEYFPDGKDEGLVCVDSREPGGFDLADKELAVLLAEVGRNEPHIAVILDACHSGSATRGADDFTQLRARQTHEVYEERPLESYLEGYYSKLLSRGESLEIPASRHILLAACERFQKAWEGKNNTGVFTSTLLEVLKNQGTGISYADLFMRCRATVRKQADNQDPQFESYSGFNAYGGFLNSRASTAPRHYPVYFEDRSWQIDCGAMHGLPSDPDKNVELTLYADSDLSAVVGHASTTQVGPQKSPVKLSGVTQDRSIRYQGQISSLPVPPLLVNLGGDSESADSFEKFLAESKNRSLGVALSRDTNQGAGYTLVAQNNGYSLRQAESNKLIQGVEGDSAESAQRMFSVMQHVADWERAVTLQNSATKMNPDDVQFKIIELLGDEKEPFLHTGSDLTVDIVKDGDDWQPVRFSLKANNLTEQSLHFLLLMYLPDYGFQPMYNEQVEPTETDFSIPLNGKSIVKLFLDEQDGDEAIFTFKLLVSTEKVDDFQLGQPSLELGKIISQSASRGFSLESPDDPPRKMTHENEWFAKDIQVKLLRQVDRVRKDDVLLAGNVIRIKGHSELQAGISLGTTSAGTRSVGAGSGIHRALERQGMELLNFSGTRGDNESVLELSDIRNPEVLKNNPLKIELDVDLSEEECILPVTFDGNYFLLVGESSRDDGSGLTQVSIEQIPEVSDNRRGVGTALKLYFFKTYLKMDAVNQLRWVEYAADGSCKRNSSGLAEKIAEAGNIALLIHGIIGDTEDLAKGMRLATDSAGLSLNQKFDLVLTYDYENLNTPIGETAVELSEQLNIAGLNAQDDKRLTIMAHSMGGLVSRWFIEREGGNMVVDHLAMFGTPNAGSPFGRIAAARDVLSVLATLAMNVFPLVVPWVVSALSRSKKLTPTLEQMHPESQFIKDLNASDDPGVRYTIVAGDTRDYTEEGTDDFVPQLIAKLGGGGLFDRLYQSAGHDIAVSDDSIRGVADSRVPPPRKELVVCHHLNYFVSESCLTLMGDIDW